MKAKELGVIIYQEAHGLKGVLLCDTLFTKYEIRAMHENWIQVEDDPDIINAEVDEAVEIFEMQLLLRFLYL